MTRYLESPRKRFQCLIAHPRALPQTHEMNLRSILFSAVLVGLLPTVSGVVVGQDIYVDSPRVEDAIGVNVHFTQPYFPKTGEMKMLADAGFRWVRTDFVWADTDTGPGPRGYDFRFYDRLVEEFGRYHLRVIFILDYNNCHYYNGESAKSACRQNPPKPESPHTDEQRQAFAQWAKAAARHFAGRGIYWEIYNEPNADDFWNSPPREGEKKDQYRDRKTDEYIALALATAKAIREVSPDEVIIGPATHKIDLGFLGACFRNGLLDYSSAVSVHPYRDGNPETVSPDYEYLRNLIAHYQRNGKKIPIISSEWGYSAWGGMTEERQGEFLAREMLSNLANNIHVSIWYDWMDDYWVSDPLHENERHFGTISYNEKGNPFYVTKPAYLAARTLTTTLRGYHLARLLDVGSANDYVLLFSNGESLRLAAWTTSTPHNLTIPANAGRFEVISWRGATLPQQVASDRGLVIALTDAPQYFIPDANRLWQIHLNGTENWHDTGIVVKQGQLINITATGRIIWNPNPENNNTTAGPDGVPYNAYRLQQPQDFPMPEANVASLIMRIGTVKYAVGRGATIQVMESGTIQLMINDRYNGLQDNTGKLTVLISLPTTVGSSSAHTFNVTLPANAAWINTGVKIETYDHVTITASGTVNTERGYAVSYNDPNGQRIICNFSNCLMRGVGFGTLIGRIGNGEPFRVGSHLEMAATSSGDLYLAVNDSDFSDNSGAFTIHGELRAQR